MTGCSAPNCTNNSKNGYRFYRFPAEPERRKQWMINSRRKDWYPTQNDRLCSAHFEDNQLEQHREDGKKRLIPFAVPTIFNQSHRTYKRYRGQTKSNESETAKRTRLNEPCASDAHDISLLVVQNLTEGDAVEESNIKDTGSEVLKLKKKVADLKVQLKVLKQALAKFLTPEQIEHLQYEVC